MRKTSDGRPTFEVLAKNEARMALARWRAVHELLAENLFAAHIVIDGFDMGVCDNDSLIPTVRQNIAEIEKFLEGKPNNWE